VSDEKQKILVDCGMFQGSNFNEGKNNDEFPFNPAEINALLVTHAHLDHIGRIPKLIKEGFDSSIYMTDATAEFAKLIWLDAYAIMVYDNKKFDSPILYNEEDINKALALIKTVKYNEEIEVLNNARAVWKDAGHIFGAAFIELEFKGKRLGFSGDIGNRDAPIIKETRNLGEIDVLLLESTYGDRIHEDVDARRSIIFGLIEEGVKKNGTIMIPAFSLERTQELLYELNFLSEHYKILPEVPIFLDSPLAIDATEVYKKYPEYYDRDAKCLHDAGDDFFDFPNLELTYTKEQSKKINDIKGAKIVIAGSGMMNGGRILHHALRYLSDPKSTLIIVGYQANGTLGRRLYEGARSVKIMGTEVPVRCSIKAIGALSAHGDQTKLVNWVNSGPKPPKQVYCVHGEPNGVTELAHKIKKALGVESYVPEYLEEVEVN